MSKKRSGTPMPAAAVIVSERSACRRASSVSGIVPALRSSSRWIWRPGAPASRSCGARLVVVLLHPRSTMASTRSSRCSGLAQRAGRQQPAVAQAALVHQRNLHLSRQAPVLQPVVGDDDVAVGMCAQQRARRLRPGVRPTATGACVARAISNGSSPTSAALSLKSTSRGSRAPAAVAARHDAGAPAATSAARARVRSSAASCRCRRRRGCRRRRPARPRARRAAGRQA